MTCRDAKLSVLEWDAASDRFVTSSLHYFEGDAALRGGRRVFARGPKAVTDPQVRKHPNLHACRISAATPADRISEWCSCLWGLQNVLAGCPIAPTVPE